MAGASAEEEACDVVLGLRADVVLHEVKVAGVEVEEEVPVGSQQGPAVQGATQPAAGVSEGLLDVVERLEHVEHPRVLVEELAGEGGAAARGGKQKDVFPRQRHGNPTVVTQRSPSGVWKKEKKV